MPGKSHGKRTIRTCLCRVIAVTQVEDRLGPPNHFGNGPERIRYRKRSSHRIKRREEAVALIKHWPLSFDGDVDLVLRQLNLEVLRLRVAGVAIGQRV